MDLEETAESYLEALKRKERLLELKRKRDETTEEDINANNKIQLPQLKFRNYNSEDVNVKENIIPAAKPVNVEKEVEDQLNLTGPVMQEINLNALAPNKSEYDLKRDIQKKLDRLEKKTNKAIAELIRERLKRNETDLATCVNIGARITREDDDDDDG